MYDRARELSDLVAALANAPGPNLKDPGGLTITEMARILGWPQSLVNERLCDLGGKVRNHKVRIEGESRKKYTLQP